MKDAQHHEGVIERGIATFKHVLESKLVEGAKGRSALHGASGAVNRGHVASSTGFMPHSLVYRQEYASLLQCQIEIANKNALTSRERMTKYHDKGKTDTRFKVGGGSVAQWYNTYLLDYWLPVQSQPVAVHLSHKKDVLAMMVIDSSMEVCPVLLVTPKHK